MEERLYEYDVMIDNWVYEVDDLWNKKLVQVKLISPEAMRRLDGGIYPVPLNRTWLVNFLFEERGLGDTEDQILFYKWFIGASPLVVSYNKATNVYCIGPEMNGLQIRFVHELQNYSRWVHHRELFKTKIPVDDIPNIKKGTKLRFWRDGGVPNTQEGTVLTFANFYPDTDCRYWQCQELIDEGNEEHSFSILDVEIV